MPGKKIRIGVGTALGPRSSVWRVAISKNDVYLAQGTGANAKLSFHASGICRHAFTREFGTPKILMDRAIDKWKRAPTMPPGSGHFSYAAMVTFPTNFLSTVFAPERKQIIWIPPAPPGRSIVLELFFTRENKSAVESYGAAQGRTLIAYTALPNGEAFAVSTYDSEFTGQEFVLPASLGAQNDIVVCSDDPERTGRPIRITVFQEANESRPFSIVEYGAYRMPKGTAYPGSMGTLTRDAVFDRQGSW